MQKSDTFPDKEKRKICHEVRLAWRLKVVPFSEHSFDKARDRFYKCVSNQGVDFKPSAPIPAPCVHLRAAFEASCLKSWVQHFDETATIEARRARLLSKSINEQESSNKAAGSLAGK
jgi:hypothetical protein